MYSALQENIALDPLSELFVQLTKNLPLEGRCVFLVFTHTSDVA